MTAPDLRILVYRKERHEGLSLSFQLEARDPELKLHFATFEPMPLRRLTEELIHDLLDGIAKLSLLGDADQLRRQLNAKGSRLTKDLLPRELLAELWRVRDRVETVEVLSEEGFVPWELLKLLEPVGRRQFRDGPFFGEVFALARWIPDVPQRLHLPLRRLAVIASHDPVLPATAEEIAFLESLAGPERRVESLRPQRTELLETMAAGRHDGWHFTGHAVDRPGDPESSGLPLEDYTELTPEDLHGVAGELGRSGPLVFLNGCHTGRSGPIPSGWSGWSRRLLEAGAGAFLGASWATSDEPAAHFARTFYRVFTGGLPIAEAVRRARIETRERFPADPTWLAYSVYAHPLARCRSAPAVAGASSPLARPIESRKDLDRLPVFTGPRLLGRCEELSRLREAFEQQGVSIVSLVGFGGVGKSALTAEFVERLAPDYGGAEAVFAWSFYSQGSHSTATSSAEFFDAALRFFCPSEDMPTDDGERVQMLSRTLRSHRVLLILDGVEPLQNPAHVDDGRFRDKSLRHLLLDLARQGVDGVVMVSSRQPLVELKRYQAHREVTLGPLDVDLGVELLRQLGVRGSQASMQEAVIEVGGHALALVLLGRLLAAEYRGDVGQSRLLAPVALQTDDDARHARRVLCHYERLWGDTGPELAFLYLLGLFDRPMAEAELRALLQNADVAPGLPAPPSRRFERLIDQLGRAGLVVRRLDTYDTHPLIRAWFALRLQETRPEELRQAHRVLFTHFCQIPQEDQPATLAGLEPLYRAVYHGCEGGVTREALAVFRRRIHRNGETYSTYRLGAYTSDLFAFSCFFPQGWAEPPREPLDARDRNDLLGQVAYCFLSLTRMNEAVAALEANLAVARELDQRLGLVIIYRQLVEALISCGRLDEALLAATRELDLLRAGDWPTEQVLALADRGYALYHLGRLAEASAAFAEAETLADPTERPLSGYAGFQMCELLLARGEWRQALDRAERGLTACAEGDAWILHQALFTLIRGQALMRGGRRDEGLADLEDAVGFARQSGADESLAHVLTNAAGEYLHAGFHERCRSRLDEASIFVDPGSMRLLAIDVALVRGELALAAGDGATARTACDYATSEIEATGYRLKRLALDKLKGSLVGRSM